MVGIAGYRRRQQTSTFHSPICCRDCCMDRDLFTLISGRSIHEIARDASCRRFRRVLRVSLLPPCVAPLRSAPTPIAAVASFPIAGAPLLLCRRTRFATLRQWHVRPVGLKRRRERWRASLSVVDCHGRASRLAVHKCRPDPLRVPNRFHFSSRAWAASMPSTSRRISIEKRRDPVARDAMDAHGDFVKLLHDSAELRNVVGRTLQIYRNTDIRHAETRVSATSRDWPARKSDMGRIIDGESPGF
jgi:hypothetical protein